MDRAAGALGVAEGRPAGFADSPNVLFATRVRAVARPAPSFVRVTLAGPSLCRFAPHQLDQRVKILLGPGAGGDDGLADGVPERRWRRAWRDLPDGRRPVLRSYTAYAVRPERGEIDLDFYLHDPAGPASAWAAAVRAGDPLLVSGPEAGTGDPLHGVQWRPGAADRLLLAADETAYPAVRGILTALGTSVRARVLLEAGDARDVAAVGGVLADHDVTVVGREGRGGEALAAAVEGWAARHGATAAALGGRFYAWTATESARVQRIRRTLLACGLDLARVHAQGYWNDRSRPAGS